MPRRKDPWAPTSAHNETRRAPMNHLRKVLLEILNRDLGLKFRINPNNYIFFRPDFCRAHGYRILVPESMRHIQTIQSLWVWRREDVLLVPQLLRDGIIRLAKYENGPQNEAVEVPNFNRAAYIRKLGPGWQAKSLHEAKRGLERTSPTSSTILVQDNRNNQPAVRERMKKFTSRNYIPEYESDHRESSDDSNDSEDEDDDDDSNKRMKYNRVNRHRYAGRQASPTIREQITPKVAVRYAERVRHSSQAISNSNPDDHNASGSLHRTASSTNILSDSSDSSNDSDVSTNAQRWRDSIKSCRDIYKWLKNDIVSFKGFMAESVSAEAKKSAEDCCYILERNLEELKKKWLPTEAEFHKSGLSDTQRTMLLRRHAERALNAKEWRIV